MDLAASRPGNRLFWTPKVISNELKQNYRTLPYISKAPAGFCVLLSHYQTMSFFLRYGFITMSAFHVCYLKDSQMFLDSGSRCQHLQFLFIFSVTKKKKKPTEFSVYQSNFLKVLFYLGLVIGLYGESICLE